MSYAIDARLKDNQARLKIVDVETGRVRVAWDCSLGGDRGSHSSRLEVQRLFRELMLLSALDMRPPSSG